jgi:superfamily II DNA or RNA helicase
MQYRPVMQVEIYSHFFKVLYPDSITLKLVMTFIRRFVVYKSNAKQGDMASNMTVYGLTNANLTEYRFHIGQYAEFIEYMDQNLVRPELYTIVRKDLYEPVKIEVSLRPSYTLFDYQEDVKAFILDETIDNDNNSRLVALQTGKGKTLTSLATIGDIKTRTMIVILPTYMEQWGKEITKILTVDPKEIMMVQGSSQLTSLLHMASEGTVTSKFIVVSMPTLRSYFKTFSEKGHDFKPEDICRLLGIGTVIIDETHQHLHGVYTFLAHTHVPRVIGLSATLMADDPVVRKMQHLMFPREIRYDKVALDKYIRVFAVAYNIKDFYKAKIQTTERGSSNYSHNVFERSLIRNTKLLEAYLDMLLDIVYVSYINKYMEGDRLLIFAASIAMCTTITDYVRKHLPERTVERFVDDDPYTNLTDPDIIVSTIGSAGTGKDIPKLRAVIMSNSINSSVSNIQAVGRLRKLPDRDVKFYYIYCDQVRQQLSYHKTKKELLRDRVASISESRYPYSL